MRTSLTISLFLIFSSLLSFAQDTTSIYFIGNSFTAANAMTQMVQGLANAANLPVYIEDYSPGGATVYNDHLYDPQVLNTIKSRQWDYIVIQDNQGAYCNYYGQITPSVLAASIQLRDSIKLNNPCTKIVWFAGWGWQAGRPDLWPSDNGVNMINRILANFTFLNDSVDEIVAPIGEAWVTSINQNPNWNLWDMDSVHPSLAGSFLTANVIFTSIFRADPSNLNYTATLSSNMASYYRATAFSEVRDSLNMAIYNLDMYTPELSINVDTISVLPVYSSYQWYLNNSPIPSATNSYCKMSATGNYHLIAKDSNSCKLISFSHYFVQTTLESISSKRLRVFPNPVIDGKLKIKFDDYISGELDIRIINPIGEVVFSKIINPDSNLDIDLPNLSKGLYLLIISNDEINFTEKIIIAK
ncbi:MAG: T9SS type A sorting domain-containing protein [Saprospiraceae bacterium]|nr:T9SS type A sorting domain-containing protein [Saprospiraceae bacterium]